MVKSLPAVWETWVWSLDQEDPLEKEMATHSSILAWKIPWNDKSGRLQSMRLQRVGHDWATSPTHSLHPFPTGQYLFSASKEFPFIISKSSVIPLLQNQLRIIKTYQVRGVSDKRSEKEAYREGDRTREGRREKYSRNLLFIIVIWLKIGYIHNYYF